MKRIYKLIFMMAFLVSAGFQLTAQVNGEAAKPLVSTVEKPIYYYIESAAGAHAGNVILPGDAVGEKLKHGALTDDNKASARWQIVLEDGVAKLKNAETGKYMSGSHTYADAGDRFDVRIYAEQNYYRIYNFGFSPTIAYNNNLLDRQGTAIPEMQWYFVVEPGSVANYNDGKGYYYTLYGRNEHTGRKLNSITFKVNDQLLKTVNIGQTFSGGDCYYDKTAEVVEVKPGDALSISFNWTGQWMHNFAYVDWDKSISFENEERLGHNSLGEGGEMTKSINYTVPTEQALGEYRLRAMVDWDGEGYSTPNHVNGKNFYGGGSVTDFTLRVTNTPKPLPPALSIGAYTAVLKGDVITLTHPEGATVKYTTDDTDPATSATAIEGVTVTVSDNIKLRAISIKDGMNSEEFVRNINAINMTEGNEYFVVFQRYDGTLALQDMGDGVPMTTQTLDLEKSEQKWKVSKGASEALYKLTSVAGNTIYWGGGKFTVSANPAEDAEVELRFVVSPNTDYSGYEIQRKASTGRGMNPIGGSQVGKEIGEWNLGDGGNVVKFLSTKGLLLAEIEKAQALYDNTSVGTEFGQYSADKKTDLQTAIDAAQAEYDKPTSDGDLAAIAAIQSAIDTFKATINDDVTTLISANARKHKWYAIRSTANHAYAKDKVISSTGREEGNKFTFESKSESVEDAQLFRFELNATNDSVKLINKANGKYMAKNGAIAAEGAVFALNVLTDGYSFNIQPKDVAAIHAQQANAHIVNWTGVAGSASAWAIDFVKEETVGTARPLVSTAEKPVYYYIESASDGSVVLKAGEPNKYLGHLIYAPNGDDGVQIKHDKKETITEASISLDNALWQIVMEDSITKLKNKGTGLVLSDARFGKTDNTNNFIAEQLSDPTQYRLRNSNQPSPAVAWYTAARGNYLDRWGSTAANSQVAWYFIVAPGSEANYEELVKPELLADLLVSINKANISLSTTPSEGIVYTEEDRDALTAQIATAQAVYDNEESTNKQITDAKATLDKAFAAYIAAGVVNPELLLSNNPRNNKWYWIRSTSTHAYAAGKVISAGTRAAGEKFTFEDKAEEPTDEQLFRVELTEDKTKVKSLINKAGFYMAADGAISETEVADNDFTLELLRDGTSLRIKPTSLNDIHAREHNTDLVNWKGDAGSASAWSFDFALEEAKTAEPARPLVSTDEKPIYYYIESAADGSVVLKDGEPNNYLGHLVYAPNGDDGVQLKHGLMETILDASINADNALWQIVTEDGVTKLKNKGTGLVLFDARFGKTDNTNNFIAEQLSEPTQYRLRNSNQPSPAVAWYTDARGHYLDRWGSDKANSQVAWFFIVAPGCEANYNELLISAYRADLLEVIENANTLLSSTVSEGIVYTDENKADFTAKVAAAQAVYDNADATGEELTSAKTTLDEAFAAYKATAVVNPELLVSTDPQKHNWYWIRSTSTHAYAAGKVISAGTRAVGEKFTFEDKAEEPTDVQLFRVELTEDKTKVKNLINKAGDTYMAANGSISETEVADNDFTLEILSDGVSLRIKPTSLNDLHAQEANTHIVNWKGDAGSASAWSFEFALETTVVIDSNPSLLDNSYVIRVNNGIITVDGVTEFDVYSIAGQKMNEKARLASGIYIVKVKEFTQKVIVK